MPTTYTTSSSPARTLRQCLTPLAAPTDPASTFITSSEQSIRPRVHRKSLSARMAAVRVSASAGDTQIFCSRRSKSTSLRVGAMRSSGSTSLPPSTSRLCRDPLRSQQRTTCSLPIPRSMFPIRQKLTSSPLSGFTTAAIEQGRTIRLCGWAAKWPWKYSNRYRKTCRSRGVMVLRMRVLLWVKKKNCPELPPSMPPQSLAMACSLRQGARDCHSQSLAGAWAWARVCRTRGEQAVKRIATGGSFLVKISGQWSTMALVSVKEQVSKKFQAKGSLPSSPTAEVRKSSWDAVALRAQKQVRARQPRTEDRKQALLLSLRSMRQPWSREASVVSSRRIVLRLVLSNSSQKLGRTSRSIGSARRCFTHFWQRWQTPLTIRSETTRRNCGLRSTTASTKKDSEHWATLTTTLHCCSEASWPSAQKPATRKPATTSTASSAQTRTMKQRQQLRNSRMTRLLAETPLMLRRKRAEAATRTTRQARSDPASRQVLRREN